MTRNVLFITYYFPPGASSGVFRPMKFVKYMKRGERWNPIVLTVDEKYYSKCDLSLLSDIPENLELHRVDSLQPLSDSSDQYRKIYHQVHLPDNAVGGIMHFVLKGLEIINSKKIDLIFCTIPHPSMALAGMMLKQMTGIPLVVDYRDAWTTNPMTKSRSEEGRQINHFFESKVLEAADGIVVVDRRIKQDLIAFGYRSDIEVILNGFDQEDFGNALPYSFDHSPQDFTISYCGYIYRDYVPSLLLLSEAIECWNMNSRTGQTIGLYVAGEFQSEEDKTALLSKPCVHYEGRLNYYDSIRFISSSAASVGIMTMDYSMGGKFYNLMLANQYIFAFIHPHNDQIQKLLRDYEGKTFITLNATVDEIIQVIDDWVQRHAGVQGAYLPSGYLDDYSRENQTSQVEMFLDTVVNEYRSTEEKYD